MQRQRPILPPVHNVRIYGVNSSTSADSYGYDTKEDYFKVAGHAFWRFARSISIRFSSNCSSVHEKYDEVVKLTNKENLQPRYLYAFELFSCWF
jgi:hypothetical protein